MSDQKVLIIQTAFIGDAILATALLEKWHQVYPDSKIDYMVRKGNEGLFAGHPFINQLLVWDKKKSKYKHLWQILQKIRKSRYDLVINLQRFASTGLLTALSSAKVKIGFDKNPLSFAFSQTIKHSFKEGTHEVQRNQSLIEKWTDTKPAMPKLYPNPTELEKVKAYQEQPYICIAPTSVWYTKQFAAPQWSKLIAAIPSNFQIYLLGAPADAEACDKIILESKRNTVINLAGKLSLLESTALISKASMNYVNDSAPLHLASATNAPTCAVYCSTVPAFGFYPLAKQSTIVQTSKALECKPCGIHGHKACPKDHFECSTTITTAELLSVLD